MNKLLDEFSEVTYKAGLLHGQGLLGTAQHRQAVERARELFQELARLLTQRPPDLGQAQPNPGNDDVAPSG